MAAATGKHNAAVLAESLVKCEHVPTLTHVKNVAAYVYKVASADTGTATMVCIPTEV